MMVTADTSSRTTAACSDCVWTSHPLTDNLSIRVAARQHTDHTQHPVVVLTTTITFLQPGPAAAAFSTPIVAEAAAMGRAWSS